MLFFPFLLSARLTTVFSTAFTSLFLFYVSCLSATFCFLLSAKEFCFFRCPAYLAPPVNGD
jgi:hypothetical protein